MTRRKWIAGAVLAPLCSGALRAQASRTSDPQALLFGTVFQGSYLALEGARIVAYDEASPKKKYRALTNFRGEYRIRVPAGDATYIVSATAPKFVPAQRSVQVYGMEKSTANLILESRKNARDARDQRKSK